MATMSVTLAFICSAIVLSLTGSEGSGAGRAFPVESENYVTERFQTINPRLEWDPTNFLIDLAGHYANCRSLGTSGPVRVDRLTPEGESVSGIVDDIDGGRSDIDAVNGYIRTVVDRWLASGIYNNKIRGGRKFGCSIRPACTGRAVISCLFSPGSDDWQAEEPEIPEEIAQGDEPGGEQAALAFTAEQYRVAEAHTGNKWDRSHFLENLSGFETRCAMIDNDNWPFTHAHQLAAKYGQRIATLYGSTPNLGSTDVALNKILSEFKSIRYASDLGCSIIPDCIHRNEMYVVVSCLYSE